MALALLRLGPDRVPPEVWVKRRFRYAMQTRQYVNQQTTTRKTESVQTSRQKPERPVIERQAPSFTPPTMTHPIDLAWNEVGVYPLLTALLGVVGVYFALWLAKGGAAELSVWFR